MSAAPDPANLVILGGLFSLGGVLLGGLLTTLTQLFLERKRERRAANRAKLLVAAEMLQAQMILRSVASGRAWPPLIENNVDAVLPTSAWLENRSALAGMVSEDLWLQIVRTYTLLEYDRVRLVGASRLPASPPLTEDILQGIRELSNDLGRLRRQLGLGGGWMDEVVTSSEEVE
jgi:hypothetical protein